MKIKANHTVAQTIIFSVIFIVCIAAAVWYDQYFLAVIPFGILLFYAGWQDLKLVLFVLLFTLPFSTEWQFSPELGTDLPDELLMLLVAGLFLCFWLYRPSIFSRNTARHPLLIIVFVMIVWAAVTILASDYPLISIKFLLAKCWYVGAFLLAPLVVFREQKNIKSGILILALMMLLVSIITILRHAQYGFSFAGINEALRPFFRNHVNYSAMLVCVIPVFIAFFKLSRRRIVRLIVVISIAILLIALFLSYARGAWLALVVGVATYWLIEKKLLMAAFITTLIFVVVGIGWLKTGNRYMNYAHNYRATIFHPDFREHLEATYKLKDLSTAERFYRWIAGVRMVNERPVTGFGPNTFYNNYKPYAIPAFKTWVSANKEHSTVHNYFLLIAVEQGLPGLLLFLLLTGGMIYYAQKNYHRAKDPFDKTIASTTAVVLMMILTVNSLSDLIETDKIGSLFFLCLSLLIVVDLKHKRSGSDPSPDI